MSPLDTIFQYRTLVGKCEAGVGVDFDEIDRIAAIEAAYAPSDDERRDGRRFRRDNVALTARLRGDDLNDRVHLTELCPGGLVVRGAPYVDEGMTIELVVDDDERSFRFKARVTWLREDVDDDFALGLELIGTPLLVHYGPAREHEDVVERIAA